MNPLPRPPKNSIVFSKYWKIFIKDVVERENYKQSHLHQLEILCDLYAEYEKLTELVDILGYTYEIEGRNGSQIKTRPEVTQLNKVRSDIRAYSSLLGITLTKDKTINEKEGAEEWD